METIISIRPLLAVCVSLFVTLPIIFFSKRANLRESATFLAGLIKLGIVLSMLPAVLAGAEIVYPLVELLPGVSLKFRVDAFGMLFALVSSSLWIVTSLYSIGYMRGLKEHSQTRYFCFFALALSATIGVAFSANLLTLYLFYEMLSFATYPLVTHHQDGEAKSSGLLLMMIFGFAKAGVMPFHSWLPAAMVAPTPVSALLHAVAVVKVGVFSIVRVLTGIFGVELLSSLNLGTVVCYVAAFTIIVSSLIALSQDELKRRLAFSTISQLSYIVLGVGLLSPKGMTGGMAHIAMHAFGKITLFFCAGAIFVATGRKQISEMVGIGKRMPITMTAFFIGALSVIGLPPSGGFISKWLLVLGTLEADQWVMLVVLLGSSLLNAAYFLPIVYRAFFCTPEESMFEGGMKEAPVWCVAPLVLTAAVSVFMFFYPQPFFRLARIMVQGLTGN